MIRITIKTDNAAFYYPFGDGEYQPMREVVRILNDAVSQMIRDGKPKRINDLNGNGVCTITYTGKDRP